MTAFFVGLGLEVKATRMFVEGEFLDRMANELGLRNVAFAVADLAVWSRGPDDTSRPASPPRSWR